MAEKKKLLDDSGELRFKRHSIYDGDIASSATVDSDYAWPNNPSYLQGAQNTNDAGKGGSPYGYSPGGIVSKTMEEYAAEELLRRKLFDQGSSTFCEGVDFGGKGHKK